MKKSAVLLAAAGMLLTAGPAGARRVVVERIIARVNANIVTQRQLLMREVIGREVGRTIIVSREDARKYFEQHKDQFSHAPGVHLAEILILTEKHPLDASQRADAALAEVKAGQRWEDVVKKYSD